MSDPTSDRLSLDKYVSRDELPFDVDASVFEMRLLTIAQTFRRRGLIAPLLYAGLRYAEHHGASRVVFMGRDALVPLYEKIGFSRTDIAFASGAVSYTVSAARRLSCVAAPMTCPT